MIPKRDEAIEAEKKSLRILLNQTHQETEKLETSRELINKQEAKLEAQERMFTNSFLEGRQWLIDMIAEAETTKDLQYVHFLNNKKKPAPTTAKRIEVLIKDKNKLLIQEVKTLEYQLKTYHEYFPLLEEYKDAILDEVIDFKEGLANQDKTLKYLTTEEYKKLSEDEKNQLALDRYSNRHKNNVEIGLLYERYIGYLHEQEGWNVTYQGALAGRLDRGIDLVCSKGDTVKLVQCKCWSKTKNIYEKYVFQLFGVLQSSIYSNEYGLDKTVKAELIITNSLGDFAEHMAELLGINIKQRSLDKDYPKIKCTTSAQGEKLYHLPIDQQYDKILMNGKKDAFYTHTVKEATSRGHRRAFRYQFNS